MSDTTQTVPKTQTQYKHSWWRILLIVIASIGFILVFVFDTLSGIASTGTYSSRPLISIGFSSSLQVFSFRERPL